MNKAKAKERIEELNRLTKYYAEKYYGDIDIYCIDEIIDDILNAPVTMEEKLADVGMSIKDFL